MADVKEWYCESTGTCVKGHDGWVSLDTEDVPTECPFCDTQKPPRPGGLKPIRPNPPGS